MAEKSLERLSEKPLERLNYYNGRRLDAADLKTEQEYHIRTRRWLNKSLYTAGIAAGLAVRALDEGPKKDAPFVAVAPGLALDSDGREIILLDEAIVEVCSYAGSAGSAGTVVGNYLVIEYGEEVLAFESGGCAVRGAGNGDTRAVWGGPSRIEAKPRFAWVPFVPPPGSNQILLARVELTQGCRAVAQIDTSARRGVQVASTARVRQYALEGERHIDKDNPGRIYFNVMGRQPNSVSLCLRSEKFSTLFYTEMGKHAHTNSASGFAVTIPTHRHTLPSVNAAGTGRSGLAGGHTPSYTDIRAQTQNIVVNKTHGLTWTLWDPPVNVDQSVSTWANFRIQFNAEPDHAHAIPTATDSEPAQTINAVGSNTASSAGVGDISARVDDVAHEELALSFVDDLRVLIGPDPDKLIDVTVEVRRQLQATREDPARWTRLGGGPGEPDHPLIKKGTGLIRLDFLPGVSFPEGEYVIQLQVASGGGRIHYNLYIE